MDKVELWKTTRWMKLRHCLRLTCLLAFRCYGLTKRTCSGFLVQTNILEPSGCIPASLIGAPSSPHILSSTVMDYHLGNILYEIKRQQRQWIVVDSHALEVGLIIVIAEVTNDGSEDDITYDICVSLIHYFVLYSKAPLCHHLIH